MQVVAIVRLAGGALALVGAALLLPASGALASGEAWLCFALPAALGLAVGGVILFATRGGAHTLDHRGALVATGVLYLLASGLGAAPFALSLDLGLSPVDALYESVAAWTTTGASLLAGRASLPGSIVLWRSLAGWLGGFTAILLAVAVLPTLGVGGLLLDPRALPGVASERLPARAFEAARVSLPLWLALTAGAALLFLASGMRPLDALCAALSCLSTGALLSPLAPGGFASAVAVAALLAGAIGVPLVYRAAAGSLVWSREPELRALVGVFAFATLLVAIDLRSAGGTCGATSAVALETAARHTAAMLATAGLHGESCGELPPFTRTLLMLLLVIGGTTASASGGLHLGRVLVLGSAAFAHFFRLVHPRGFQMLRVGGRALPEVEIFGIAGFVAIWLAALVVGACALALHGLDTRASLAAAAAALANSDAAWSGSTGGVAALAPTGKLVLAALMLLGRLELYYAVVLFAPGLWRRSWR